MIKLKQILSFFIFVSILGIALFAGSLYMTKTGQFILVPIEEFRIFELPTTAGQAYEQPILTPPTLPAEGEISKEELIPEIMYLYINKIPIVGQMYTSFIPIYYDDMKTFSGRFGPYDFDARPYIEVKLCSFPKTFPDMLNCETVELNYANNFASFARGYNYDEFIARQALKNYGVVYFILSPIYGNIAQSPTGIVKLIEHD